LLIFNVCGPVFWRSGSGKKAEDQRCCRGKSRKRTGVQPQCARYAAAMFPLIYHSIPPINQRKLEWESLINDND